MKNKLLFLSLLLLPALLLASGHSEGGETTKYFATTGHKTDIWYRLLNFVIFAGLLYYLLADKLKAFLVSRQEGIANQLKEIENKLELAKKEEKSAKALVKDSETKAKTIVLAGVLGKYENEGHMQGTKEIFEAVANSTAFKIAGGGDTILAIDTLAINHRFDWISVGGGAMLEFRSLGTLPGIEALLK